MRTLDRSRVDQAEARLVVAAADALLVAPRASSARTIEHEDREDLFGRESTLRMLVLGFIPSRARTVPLDQVGSAGSTERGNVSLTRCEDQATTRSSSRCLC